ncbi:MAG: alpha/beta hydrolase [Polyangiaceae bacterium]|nr:alpha/beta hydrolase [Polyangiaceae bacterium]
MFTSRRERIEARAEREEPAQAYVTTALGRLSYEERGKAKKDDDPVVVLLHGLLFDGGSWNGQIEPLSTLGRVVVFDGPGHGKSDVPPNFSLEEHADALARALTDLGVTRAILVGLSWGGMLAMRVALQHPSRVAGLALLDTSAEAPTAIEKIRYRAFVELHRWLGLPRRTFLSGVAPLLFAPETMRKQSELVMESYAAMMRFNPEGLARAALAVLVRRTDILKKISSIRVPALIVCGREDRSCPPSRSKNMAGAISGSELVILERLGHMSALEDPAAVNAHLVPFVDKTMGRRG